MSVRSLVEESFFIAWSFLERTGELGPPDSSADILLDAILDQLRNGERRKLMLANRAITLYRERRFVGDVSSDKEARRG